jgi:hypothetical protein
MKARTQFPDGVDQRSEIFRVHIRCNAMTEVEYMTITLSKAVQGVVYFPPDDLPVSQQYGRIQISLQSNLVANAAAGFSQ